MSIAVEQMKSSRSMVWLHRVAAVLAVGTVLLIAKGGLVTMSGAGLSVPDWPTTYGENMFTYPLEKWYGGIVYEHGHRLIATGIGVLTIAVLILSFVADRRRWLRMLAVVALVAALGEKQAVIVGHDWGAPVAWHAAMFRPDVFTAVAGLSVPPPLRGRGRPLDTLRAQGIENFYWQYFQTPGVAERELERDVAFTTHAMVARGFLDPAESLFVTSEHGFLGDPAIERTVPDWIGADELVHFTATYQATGFRGGPHW